MPPPLISLHDVWKSYTVAQQSIAVLRGISLQVQRGEMLAILGASGSGKSTLMNIIGLLDCADSGQYLLDGEDVTRLNEDVQAERRNRQIGFVFQQFNLLPRLSVYHNVALPLQYRSMETACVEEQVHQSLEKVGMKNYSKYLPTQLSGGQQQRVAIARALVGDPEIILADEPSGALDSRTGAEVMALFHQLHQEGRTLLLITHDFTIAAQCQRQIKIHDGCFAFEETACV